MTFAPPPPTRLLKRCLRSGWGGLAAESGRSLTELVDDLTLCERRCGEGRRILAAAALVGRM